MNFKNISNFSHIAILCCIFSFGYFAGKFSQPSPSKITTTTQTNNVVTQKLEVVTQATTKKDSSMGKITSYTEKYFNNKGFLVHEINYGSQFAASVKNTLIQAQFKKKDEVQTSQTQTTTTTTYRSTLFLGIGLPVKDLKSPEKILSNLSDINFKAEYRPWEKVNFFAESNYKLNVQAGFLIAVN